MGLVAVQGCDLVEFKEFAVDADLGVSPLAHLLDELLVMALSSSYKRREEVALAVLVVLHDQSDDLLVCIADHRLAGMRRICGRCAGIEQTQEIVDFRDRTYCRTGIVAGCLLLDGNDRAEARYGLDFRLFEDAHEMLCICGKRIHVPALTLGIDGIKRKR